MRILSFQSGPHDASAAAFEDYRLLAAVQEERLRREKSWGGDVPWLAIDEVLRIAGWSRFDVDAIALIRGVFPVHYLRFPLLRDLYYTARRSAGRERLSRDLAMLSTRTGKKSEQLFRADRFIAENGFRPDVDFRFVNHHEAHAPKVGRLTIAQVKLQKGGCRHKIGQGVTADEVANGLGLQGIGRLLRQREVHPQR